MLTIADIERKLLVAVGPFLSRVGLDATTANGANPSLEEPIRRAVSRLVGSPWDQTRLAAADADLEGLELTTLLDLATLRTLEQCRDNWAEFDETKGEVSQSLSQLTKALDDRIAALTQRLGPIAVEPDSATLPGPAAHGVIRAGLCYPPRGLRHAYADEHPYGYGGW
jgi:hypothetical protein